MRLTHASFFSGAGGTDIGLEAAGWTTVSVSEVDPYANAVLAFHWPEVPNLGDITKIRLLSATADRLSDDLLGLGGPDGGRDAAAGGASGEHHVGAAPDGLRGEPEGVGRASGGGHEPDAAGGHEEPNRRDDPDGLRLPEHRDGDGGGRGRRSADPAGLVRDDWRDAVLWSGGFPCQDLSVAGKRKGFRTGERSVLAFSFFDLVRDAQSVGRGPRAILLENVPGLLSSHGGRDFGRLLGEMAELGFGVAWRELDGRHFDVPQRRRRIFILGLLHGPDDPDFRLAALSAAEVLALGTRCDRHPPTGGAARSGPAAGAGEGALRTGLDIAGSLTRRYGKGVNTTLDDGAIVTGEAADARGVRTADGLAGRLDDRPVEATAFDRYNGVESDLAPTLPASQEGGFNHVMAFYPTAGSQGVSAHEEESPSLKVGSGLGIPSSPAVFVKRHRAASETDDESWSEGDVSPTVNRFDVGDTRATVAIVSALDTKQGGVDDNEAQSGHLVLSVAPSELSPTLGAHKEGGWRYDVDTADETMVFTNGFKDEDNLLPLGLDGHRYRLVGNGVIAPVAEWLGHRLAQYFRENP